MNISIIIGMVIAFGMCIYGMGSDVMLFVDFPSLAITLGGTMGVLVACFPLSVTLRVPKLFIMAFKQKKFDPYYYIDQIVEYAKIARSKGLLALEDSANQCTDPFLKQSLMLIVDANDAEKVRAMLEDSLDFMCERHDGGRAFFEKGLGSLPAFGMIGTLIGLIAMLDKLSSDPGGLGAGMAIALITTFYGSFFANCLFAPIASSLKNSHDAEVLCMMIVIEGVMAIQSGANPRFIQEKLEFMLPKKSEKDKKGKNNEKPEQAG